MNLSPVDLIIVAVYILLIVYSGTFVKKYIKNISAFLVAERSMGLCLGLASLVSSEIGIITYMYLAEAGYKNGFAALMIGIPFFIVFLFLGKTGFMIKPLLEMKIMTIPELFQKKFGRGVRFYAGLLMAVGGIINFGVFPGVEAKFINTITGIPQEYILYTMIGLLAVVLIYTALGGMVSVIFTNYIQFALLGLGMIFITVIGVLKVGWSNIVQAVQGSYGAAGLNPFARGSQFGWTFLAWQILFQLSVLTIAPYITMRVFSSKDTGTGKRIFTWSSIMFLGRAFIPVFWGIMAFALFTAARPEDPLQGLPLMILRVTPKGALGIVVAALLAASMSTYSSYLLSWSSVISQDLINVAYERATGKKMTGKTQMIVSRLTMTGVILFIIAWSFFFKSQELLFFFLMLAVNLFLAGTLVSAFFGIYVHDRKFRIFRGRPLGAYLAFTLGAAPTVWFFFPKHPAASALGVWSYGLSFAGMIIGSVIQNILRPGSGGEGESAS